MAAIFDRRDLSSHLFNIPELDFHEDLFADRLGDQWFRLGAWTVRPQRDHRGVEDVIERQSIMLAPGNFSEVYDQLEAVGNVLRGLGVPGGFLSSAGEQNEYAYAPFHRFDLRFTSISCEPLVFMRRSNTGIELFVNPDLYLFFELEERTSGGGIWWDPKRGVEALRRRVVENGNVQIVEIRVDYLRKYLQARQLSLLVGHYRHLHFFEPSPEIIKAFVKEDVVAGSPDQGVKASFQNWGLRQDILGPPFLQRRLHLWFEIQPSEINIDDPWADEPPFDLYEFTLPTRSGPVAPGRWSWKGIPKEGQKFQGEVCDFMDRIYFKQEVLSKYEGASGFDVLDDGSVSCRGYWGLVRSTSRIGNELLSTAIGDFAEGVPFEEWSHWRQYAVEPPGQETAGALSEEQTIPDAVNSLIRQLDTLNVTFASFANMIGVEITGPLWRGSLESLAGRQLKWVYPTTADDDEFLKRATLMSTLVIDGLTPKVLRKLLLALANGLHLNDQCKSLGSRKLLERVTLIAMLIKDFQPIRAEIPLLVKQAEGQDSASDPDLQTEVKRSFQKIRDQLAPLAFLYDLRTHGGLAHAPNKGKVATAVAKFDLPERNWRRTDYLRLLSLVAVSIGKIDDHLIGALE
jgi:hypothetical protein